jgi:hypothetical protein
VSFDEQRFRHPGRTFEPVDVLRYHLREEVLAAEEVEEGVGEGGAEAGFGF